MIVFGTRRTVAQLAMVVLTCVNCRRTAANAVLRTVTKFTLFFVPLFPVRTRYATQCTACGFQQGIDKARAEQLRQAPPAGRQPFPGQAPWVGPAAGGTNGHAAPGQYPGARG
ncbi:MAG TPA: zinc-ribbon domain-containing protein [Actinomycetospora sp.]|nr:zinc-ribbon domain-containing protein [Actinomycetospora sp.]